jgi:sigma-B regulation protein RsbU (phosphoserine phosphatase)
MNGEMRNKLGLDAETVIGSQFESLLTVGSKIFFQTHFYPLIKMQHSAREIYLSFKGPNGDIPALLNVEMKTIGDNSEIHCGGMEISNRNRFEKELIEAKKAAEDALAANAELTQVKNDLVKNQHMLESQYRKLRALKEQQQELFKLIAHDLQEPLRKSVFFSDYLVNHTSGLSVDIIERLERIGGFNTDMRDMLLTLQRFEALENTTLNYSPIDLTKLLGKAMASLESLNENEADISYSFSNPEFLGDATMLMSLFVELLRHSQKQRNPKNEKLKIEISAVEIEKNIFLESRERYQYEKFIKITYVDNGLGFNIDSSKIFKIIQKSEQFNKISIGLAFCKRIVEKHSGSIVAKSVKEKGIGYTIFLPIKNPTETLLTIGT